MAINRRTHSKAGAASLAMVLAGLALLLVASMACLTVWHLQRQESEEAKRWRRIRSWFVYCKKYCTVSWIYHKRYF